MNESRSEKFKRLATQRTNAVLDKLRLVGNLSNKSNYDYSEEDIKKVFNVIEGQIRNIKLKFSKDSINSFKL